MFKLLSQGQEDTLTGSRPDIYATVSDIMPVSRAKMAAC